MSGPRFSIIPAGAVTDKRLKGHDLHVLALLGQHTNNNGWCRRSQVVMARQLDCARSTVQASIDRLVEAGWVEKRVLSDPHTEGERASAHEYRVVLDVRDEPQDVVAPPADIPAPPADLDRHPLPTQTGTYVNDSCLTNSLRENARAQSADQFDELWSIFPKRPRQNRQSAQKAFKALPKQDRQECLVAAKRYAEQFRSSIAIRRETPERAREFAPAMAAWITSGQWRDAGYEPGRADELREFVVLAPADPRFVAIERHRGRSISLGKSGKITVRQSEVDAAMRAERAA